MKQLFELGEKVDEYEIFPRDSHKSFYGKARVCEYSNGAKVLYSYNTPVIAELAEGEHYDLCGDWTATTGRHIVSFCGLNKKQVIALPLAHKSGYPDGTEYIETED